MTLRIHVDSKGNIIRHIQLDHVSLCEAPLITPRVLENMAMLKLTQVGDVVDNIGVKLNPLVYIVCELPPGHNPTIEDITIFIKATS
jgi:hypothetical protein